MGRRRLRWLPQSRTAFTKVSVQTRNACRTSAAVKMFSAHQVLRDALQNSKLMSAASCPFPTCASAGPSTDRRWELPRGSRAPAWHQCLLELRDTLPTVGACAPAQQCGPPPVSVNEVLLAHSSGHAFPGLLWLLSRCTHKTGQLQLTPRDPGNLKPSCPQKKFVSPVISMVSPDCSLTPTTPKL